MKKVLVVLSFFLIFAPAVLAQSENIREFQDQITINPGGTIDVAEYIKYDFGISHRHGIYRDIPYLKIKNGKKYQLTFDVLSVTDPRGLSYKYTVSKNFSDKYLRVKIGDPKKTITGIHEYVIHYTVYGALSYFPDHDELYWNMTGNGWQVPILKTSAFIAYYPPDLKLEDVQLRCYTGQSSSTGSDCISYKKNNKAVFEGRKVIQAGEGLTLAVGFPKGQVAILEPELYISWHEQWWGKVIILLLATFGIWWYLIYPFQIVYKWIKYGRDPDVTSGQARGSVRAWFEPPKTKAGRPLTPAETGGLIDEKIYPIEIWATIINLAQRGYLRIEERDRKDFYLLQKKQPDSNLLPFESELLAGIFKDSEELKLKGADLHITILKVQESLYRQLIADDFFDKNPESIRTYYRVIVVFSAITLSPLLFISSLIFGLQMPRRTLFGAEQVTVAKSLKNFLTSQERQLKFQADRQVMFEKLLPYAIAFGVEKIWADRFKDTVLKQPNWYVSHSRGFNSTLFTSSLNSSFNSFASATSSSSSGFSGGSSGGGGGGGGGGSW